MMQRSALDRSTWVWFARVVRAFSASEAGGRGVAMFLLLIVLLLGINGLNVINSYVGRDFMTAIADRHKSEFVRQTMLYLGVFAASTVVAVIYRFVEERLGLLWREWQTRRLVNFYLAHRTYYRLKVNGEVENPDQRIADDVRALTVTTLSFALMVLNGTITVVAFSGVMWSISPLLLERRHFLRNPTGHPSHPREQKIGDVFAFGGPRRPASASASSVSPRRTTPRLPQ